MVRHTLGRFTELAGSSLGRYFDDSDESFRKLDDRGWSKIFQELDRQDKASIAIIDASATDCQYEFHYIGGAGPIPSEPPVEMCALYCFLPTEYLDEHGPDSLVELALRLIGPLPISSGNLGLAFLHPWNEDIVTQVKKLGARHPGIEVVKYLDATTEQGDRINGIAWLTFLGQPLLGEVGGTAGLRARLMSPTTTVQGLEGDRAMIRLGPWPEAGDLQTGDNLPAYRELAQILEPWLFHGTERQYWRVFSPEELLRWERRFID